MHHPTDRITHTPAFVTPVVEHWVERQLYGVRHTVKDHTDSERKPAVATWATLSK